MNIPHSLALVIQRSHSLAEILDRSVQLVAKEMGTDACSIYLLDPTDQQLRLSATHGLDKASLGKVTLKLGEGLTGKVVRELRSLAVEDASVHPGYRYFPETREEQFHSYLGVPLAIRNRPVGALVVQTRDRRDYDVEEVQTLSTIAAQLVGVVENARLIDALDRGHEGMKYLKEARIWQAGGRRTSERPGEDIVFKGSAASRGIAIGAAVLRGTQEVTLESFERPVLSEDEERALVREAFKKASAEIAIIQAAAEQEIDEEHALIFSSHLLLLNDVVVHEQIEQRIKNRSPAHTAIFETLDGFVLRLRQVADPYIQERVEDIYDLRSRLMSHLGNSQGRSFGMSDKIVVTYGIAPSLVVELKAQGARGIITARGGPTSHGALLARSMGIPAVTGLSEAVTTIRSGDTLILDGQAGKVILSPSRSSLADYEERLEKFAEQRKSALRFCNLPGRTKDGRCVALQANISVTADLATAKESGAEGIGLYRTEFPFLIREEFPTRAEQVRIYQRPYDYYPTGPVRFRLLDLGGDKLLPGNSMQVDRDPFRGYRSLRLLLDHPEILSTQVEAFIEAAGTRPVEVLIPMVTSMPELRRALKLIREAVDRASPSFEPAVRLGAMIEVPAAVELAGSIAREVDFLSIGSNDLIQYMLAADRENEKAATEDDPYHPAVLRAIRRVVEAGHRHGAEVTLCGELAGRRRLALALLAMNIDALSLAPGSIPEIKRLFTSSRVGPLAEALDSILALDTAQEIKAAMREYVPPQNVLE